MQQGSHSDSTEKLKTLQTTLNKVIKSQQERTGEEERNRKTTEQPENNEQNGNKYTYQ